VTKYLLAISLLANGFLYMLADSQAEDAAGYNYAVDYLVEDLIMARTMTNISLERMDDYKVANEALLEHCEPRSRIKAIKATPLPDLIKVTL
jgi:hypothetical protein